MFVPIDLLVPIIDEICENGRRLAPPRPWLGMLVHDDQNDLTVVGVYRNCPADKAGLRPGDVIVGIDDEPVAGLANMFRRVWSLGSAGVDGADPRDARYARNGAARALRRSRRLSAQGHGAVALARARYSLAPPIRAVATAASHAHALHHRLSGRESARVARPSQAPARRSGNRRLSA